MNGTGTQADPYQITTVEEFVKAISIGYSDSDTYAKLMNDIDFNNSDYINIDTLSWRCKYFDGQNHKISNIYIQIKDVVLHLWNILLILVMK